MTRSEQLEAAVQTLTERELATFRAWFSEFDAAEWDRAIEHDVESGRLDASADAALADQAAGRSRKL